MLKDIGILVSKRGFYRDGQQMSEEGALSALNLYETICQEHSNERDPREKGYFWTEFALRASEASFPNSIVEELIAKAKRAEINYATSYLDERRNARAQLREAGSNKEHRRALEEIKLYSTLLEHMGVTTRELVELKYLQAK